MTEMGQRCLAVRKAFEDSRHPITEAAICHSERYIPVSDGNKLRTLIYRPSREGKFPTIFMRTCYFHEEAYYCELASQYALRGFAFVIQYCRGTGGSEGKWIPNVNERADGKAGIDWLCEQEWVTVVGYWGTSYLALTGWSIADLLPEKVKTMYLTLYGTHRHISAYQDGMFRHDVLTSWAMDNAGYSIDAGYIESCLFRPHVLVDERLWGQQLEWYREWVTNPEKDAAYWQSGFWKELQEIPSHVSVPVFMAEGWYDHHLGSALETWKNLSHEAQSHSEFHIGPWNHWDGVPLENDMGEQYQSNRWIHAYDWFHRILVDGVIAQAKVLRYIIKSDSWLESDKLDLEQSDAKRLYLSKDGLVFNQKDILPGCRSYCYDPEYPVYSHGGESMLKSQKEIGSLLQPQPNFRDDVISFVSPPLAEDQTICGSICVKLFVKSDAEDTAFVVKVMNVLDDRYAYNVRGGITTLAFRNGADKPKEYVAGTPTEINISMWDIAWTFKAGTRIRIDIQSSDFPQYCIHSNKAGIWSLQKEIRVAEQTIYFNKDQLSCVELPVIKI